MTRPIRFGIDRLLTDSALRRPLAGKRIALLAHPASVTADLTHSLDALAALPDLNLSAAFGPQHGLRGDKQDNMVESPDFLDPQHGIPVFSLYGEVRRPTDAMMDSFDVLLVDLQDLGCRIYTFITTLRYVLEAAAQHGKSVWVLDRPNPAGRPVEGLTLRAGWESFVGAGAMPMRHGLTMGELGQWFIDTLKLDVEYHIIEMQGWQPDTAPGYGWPLGERSWINPSPNAPNLSMARAYAGTVMLEGTTLSEGRGTTRPLAIFGAPDIDARAVLAEMQAFAPHWLTGCKLREIWFEPTFHKYAGKLCNGLQIHVDDPGYEHTAFRPWRLQALAFKAIRRLYPDYPLWRDFAYEYEHDRLAIDLINGSPLLREWVDDPVAIPSDLDQLATLDESAWTESRQEFLSYGIDSKAFNHPAHSIQVAEPESDDENIPDRIWVGSSFKADGNGILVLGESWYGTREQYPGDLITDHGWITAYLNEEKVDPLYTRIANSVEQNQHNAKHVFWKRVAFTNFVRQCVGPDRNHRPSEDDYRFAIPRLRQLLAEHKPRGVLVLGRRQSSFSGPTVTESGIPWECVRHPTGEYGVRNQEISEAWERLLSRLPQP